MLLRISILAVAFVAIAACSDDDDDGTEADFFGVGAICSESADCRQDLGVAQECLHDFSGGYCGVKDCGSNSDCPAGAACVAHDNGTNYCFRLCTDKSECNFNRPPDLEANCSSNVEFTDGKPASPPDKACVPPSSG